MINIQGGVVSVGRNDTLQDISISNAMIVVDMDDVKSEQEVKDWIGKHFDNVEIHGCDVLTNEVYADFVMRKAESKAKRQEEFQKIEAMIDDACKKVEPLVTYRPPIIERVVSSVMFWVFMMMMNATKYFVGVPTFSQAVNAVTFGCFAAFVYFAVKRAKRLKSLMSVGEMPPTKE